MRAGLNTTEKDLLENVKQCWSSLFTPRALHYRAEHGLLETEIAVAVVVQQMVNSEVSGIVFTAHPVTKDRDMLVLEAAFGLGEAIVQGMITPDTYIVNKKDMTIFDTNIGTQSKKIIRNERGHNETIELSEEEGSKRALPEAVILDIAKLSMRIEQHYGHPQDIEFAHEAGKTFIVQSRPITTLGSDGAERTKARHPLTEVDWVQFLERRRSCFIYHPYIRVESVYLPKVMGFGYKRHLYKWSGDKGTHYRSASELQRSLEHYLSVLKDHPAKVREYRDLCLKWDKRTRELTKVFDGGKSKQITLDDFEKYYEEFIQILLYTVTVPYLCLCAIDYALVKGEKKESYRRVLSLLEPLRGFTSYPKLERSMLAHFWELISERSGIEDRDLIDKLTPQEIMGFVRGGGLPPMGELRKRKEWCVFWHDPEDERIVFEYDPALIQELPFLQEQRVELEEGVISGQTAYPGYVQDRVSRVDSAKDLEKYVPGNVVVSINTSPDLMPALRSCSAIVSDEGGIMCHAAIVSRELKKPCVIGTKVATKVLKEGDLVEVDAEKGIVRILKRAG